jgi:O-antigen/teichoic acid export membrane protein
VFNKLISIFTQIINIFFLLLINRFFYQEFGIFFLGLYNAAVILTQFILIFSDFGLTAGITHQIAKYRVSNPNYVIKLAQSVFFISIIFFLFFIFILGYFLQNPIFLSFLDIENLKDYLIIYFLIIGMLISIPRNVLGSILMGYNLPHVWSYLNLFSNFINLLGLIITLNYGLSSYVVGYVYIGTNILSLLIFAICIIFYSNYKILIAKFDFKSLSKIFDFSLKIYFGSLISFFSSFIDRILVFSLISINYLGIYSVIHSISQKIEIVGSSIATTIFPELTSNINDSKKKFTANSKSWLEFNNFVSLNVGILIYCLSDYIYYFVFNEMPGNQIKMIFLIIILSYIAKSFCNLSIWIISSFNKPEVQIYYGTISSLSYLLIILFFYSNLKIEIIALSFLFSNMISLIFLTIFLNKILNSIDLLNIYKKFMLFLLCSAIYLIFLYSLFYYLSDSIFNGVFVCISYFLFLSIIFFKTNLLKYYKDNKIIKFILMKFE